MSWERGWDLCDGGGEMRVSVLKGSMREHQDWVPTEPDWWLSVFFLQVVAPIPSYQLDHLPWKGSKKLSNYIKPRVKLVDYFEEYFNERNLLRKSPSCMCSPYHPSTVWFPYILLFYAILGTFLIWRIKKCSGHFNSTGLMTLAFQEPYLLKIKSNSSKIVSLKIDSSASASR